MTRTYKTPQRLKVGGSVATPQATAVNIGTLLDKQKLSLFHLGTFLLCALIIIVDAADTGSANVAAPAILRAFPAMGRIGGTTGPLAIGYVFSAKVLLYAVAGPYLIVMVLNFMLGRIYRRQFRTPVVATAGE
jgi:hypothetical protein